jgi:hypothetical protein
MNKYKCIWRSKSSPEYVWEWTMNFESADSALEWATSRHPQAHCIGVFRVPDNAPVGSGKRNMRDGKPQPWNHDRLSNHIAYWL